MNKDEFNKELLGFLDASPTPFHATKNIKEKLLDEGYIELDERDEWSLEFAKNYFITRNDSSIIAFNYYDSLEYLFLLSHTDSPNLKLKPNPTIKEHGATKLGVEPYGGVLYSTWFDRDLSLAGRVNFIKDTKLDQKLIDFKKPIATIPSLAIHLDREANKEKTINAQNDLPPLVGSDINIEEMILKELQADELLSYELSFYDTQKASFVGAKDEFILSARLDNLLSCFVGTKSLVKLKDKPIFFFASDHEEVGSSSVAGADGSFLEDVLLRVFGSKKPQMARSSMAISMDNAHAIHPNFAQKHDLNHAPHINKGVVVKINSNHRYASNSNTIARFKLATKKAGENLQDFVTRSDMGCGSTIGPIVSSKIGIDTIDVGVPTFAMHSIRESCGSDDTYSLYNILLGFY
ncbi:MAG: M18 family aminopeptidase [Sulfurimonas sp.]|nr:M18 family aminopeptidase [Sulfurimonadaceae bacterium]